MSELTKDTLAFLIMLIIGLFFGNLWAVQSDRQAEAEHQQVIKWKSERGEKWVT